ncbi:hypothetical protein CIB48_g9046 [Xylaria polymorpha]|nr:hypothetical protein CIB48_g9046 [Xylaria polymorpha]
MVPSDPCWPSTAVWDSFNTTISGRLIQSVPPAAVCYPSRQEYDQKVCQDILEKWTEEGFYSSDPITINSQKWAGDSCNPIYPNGTGITGDVNAGKKGCSIGMYPLYVVNTTEATTFKRPKLWIWNKYGLRKLITHYMKHIEFYGDFKPQGCFNRSASLKQMAATLGASVQDGELFAKMANHNAITVSGMNNVRTNAKNLYLMIITWTFTYDVGVVGWATGSPHGRTYGNGADNTIEATIITPDGNLLTADACQNTDIFWAIRGGRGGTTSPTAWLEFVAKFAALLTEAKDRGLQWILDYGCQSDLEAFGIMTVSETPVDNALNPAWRDTAIHLIIGQEWDDSTPASQVNEMVDDMTYNKLNILRKLEPSSGAYLNESLELVEFGNDIARLLGRRLLEASTSLQDGGLRAETSKKGVNRQGGSDAPRVRYTASIRIRDWRSRTNYMCPKLRRTLSPPARERERADPFRDLSTPLTPLPNHGSRRAASARPRARHRRVRLPGPPRRGPAPARLEVRRLGHRPQVPAEPAAGQRRRRVRRGRHHRRRRPPEGVRPPETRRRHPHGLAARPGAGAVSDQVFYKVNVEGTRAVIAACQRSNVKALVYTSSASVISDNKSDLINATEEYPVIRGKLQSEYYSETKAHAEQLVLEANRAQDSDLLTTAIRPSGIFGEGDVQLVYHAIGVYRSGNDKVQVGLNTNMFDFTYVENVAHAHLLAARALLVTHASKTAPLDHEKVDGEAFLVSNGSPVYFWDMMRSIWREAGSPRGTDHAWVMSRDVGLVLGYLSECFAGLLGRQPTLTRQRIIYSTMTRYYDISKARRRLGYEPLVSLDEGVKRTVKWTLEQEKATKS